MNNLGYAQEKEKNMIKEKYYTGYQPKLDIDKYAYYVDDTNKKIMYKIIEEYLNEHSRMHDFQYLLDAFSNRLIECPIIVYLESYQVAYDSIKDNNINNLYAGKHDYTVIKLERKQLISAE